MKNILRKSGAFALIALSFGLVSCGGDTSSVTTSSGKPEEESSSVSPEPEQPSSTLPEGDQTYIFEAEYTNVLGLVGGGISGSASGINMVLQSSNASNGWYVGYLHKQGIALTFVIESSKAAKADLTLVLGTELGVMALNPEAYDISVNGTSLDYTDFTIRANSSQIGTDFREYAITPEIDLVEGENTLVFTTGVNTYCNGASGGPLFDAIKLTTDSTLTWTPIESNIE